VNVSILVHAIKKIKKYIKKERDRERESMNKNCEVQGGSNVTGTNCDLFTHK
jgi:hypothetical protein